MKQCRYFWLFWVASILFSPILLANDQQRYLAILLLNLDRSLDADLDLLEGGVKAGCNAVHLTIHWDQVYPTATSQADWRKYDNQIALAQKLGVKVALRIHVGRNEGRIQGFGILKIVSATTKVNYFWGRITPPSLAMPTAPRLRRLVISLKKSANITIPNNSRELSFGFR